MFVTVGHSGISYGCEAGTVIGYTVEGRRVDVVCSSRGQAINVSGTLIAANRGHTLYPNLREAINPCGADIITTSEKFLAATELYLR